MALSGKIHLNNEDFDVPPPRKTVLKAKSRAHIGPSVTLSPAEKLLQDFQNEDTAIAKDIANFLQSSSSSEDLFKDKPQQYGNIPYYFHGPDTPDDLCQDLFRMQVRNLALGPALTLPRSIAICLKTKDAIPTPAPFKGTLPSDFRVMALYLQEPPQFYVAIRTKTEMEGSGLVMTHFRVFGNGESTQTIATDVAELMSKIFGLQTSLKIPVSVSLSGGNGIMNLLYAYDILSRYQPNREDEDILLELLKTKVPAIPPEIDQMYKVFRKHQNLFIYKQSGYRDRTTIPTYEKLTSLLPK